VMVPCGSVAQLAVVSAYTTAIEDKMKTISKAVAINAFLEIVIVIFVSFYKEVFSVTMLVISYYKPYFSLS